jgi:aspartyl-tRNA(Asn)/glutamyl-tRNA(Gln) amidotransferase subunit B
MKMDNKKFSPIIGLEVHVELATKSKMFCGCPAQHFGKMPNTQTCPVCLGLPGALPVPNKKAIEWTIMLALALDCHINLESHFDRKSYFYPDLPKGYQITQYERPFGYEGEVRIRNYELSKTKTILDTARMTKTIRIRRVHLEEDTGKLQHQDRETLIDFNRSGVPLVEIVTEPDFRSIEEVDQYLKKLQRIIRYIGISNADMEKGSMRLEPSISMREMRGMREMGDLPNYRVELKNINSFKFVRKALEYEIKRQTEALRNGETLKQETRGYDSIKNLTFPQRGKEEAHDYRYFPEPDIPPIRMSNEQLAIIQSMIPELPDQKCERFQKDYGLSYYQANILTEEEETADTYEEIVKEIWKMVENKKSGLDEIIVANLMINKKFDWRKETAQEVVQRILTSRRTIAVDEKELEKIVQKVLAENSKAVADYKGGKIGVLGFLIGNIRKIFPNIRPEKIEEVIVKYVQKM